MHTTAFSILCNGLDTGRTGINQIYWRQDSGPYQSKCFMTYHIHFLTGENIDGFDTKLAIRQDFIFQ